MFVVFDTELSYSLSISRLPSIFYFFFNHTLKQMYVFYSEVSSLPD